MNPNFRNLAIWVVIGLLLMALFNLFQNPSQSRRGNEISYSDFLAGVDAGNVSEVTIAKHRISGSYRDKSSTFTTISPAVQKPVAVVPEPDAWRAMLKRGVTKAELLAVGAARTHTHAHTHSYPRSSGRTRSCRDGRKFPRDA